MTGGQAMSSRGSTTASVHVFLLSFSIFILSRIWFLLHPYIFIDQQLCYRLLVEHLNMDDQEPSLVGITDEANASTLDILFRYENIGKIDKCTFFCSVFSQIFSACHLECFIYGLTLRFMYVAIQSVKCTPSTT